MRIVLFCHSLLSDWNHGNAHFLRGVVSELVARGHDVRVYEPRDAWSLQNLIADHGTAPIDQLRVVYPAVAPVRYDPSALDLDEALAGASLVLVHEWNDPALVGAIGEHHLRSPSYRLLFHDTHHRSVTDPASMARYDLSGYDGVLAFGRVIRDLYVARRWTKRAFVWHEAADTLVFHPRRPAPPERDVVWIGNYGDGERADELEEFLIDPVRELGLTARIHGVRYPARARAVLQRAGIEYAGWLPNHRVPDAFARARVTIHVPRRPYAASVPGIPTIRPFEAMACAIPLITAPWSDVEGLFTPGSDYLVAADGAEMKQHLRALLDDPARAAALAAHGRRTVLARHTCAHRVDDLLRIWAALGAEREVRPGPAWECPSTLRAVT